MKSVHKIYAECAGMVKALGYSFPKPKEVKVNTRSTRRWGCVKWEDGMPVALEIAADMLQDDVADFPAYNTMLHEIAHLVAGWDAHHGKEWQEVANAINERYGYRIKRCSNYSDYGLRATVDTRFKWVATCTECGAKFYRNRRRNGTLYHAGKCGGSLSAWEPTNPPALTAPVVVAANEQEPAGKVVRFNGKEYRVNV